MRLRPLRRLRPLLALGITLLTLSGSPQNQEDRWTVNVDRQLLRVSSALREAGYVKSSTTFADSISQGQQQYLDVTLQAHTTYGFVAVCDQDCSDLDLFLQDDSGHVIDSDTGKDDTPTVAVTPRYTGSFRLYVRMVSCSRGPCRWGLGIYLRN